MPLTQTVAPTAEPVSLEEAKAFLRVDGSDDDGQIATLLAAARSYHEIGTKRQFVTATWRQTLSEFPYCGDARVWLYWAPIQSVTSITYLDTAGATQTLSSSLYQVVADPEGGYVLPAYNQSWPTIREQEEAITITYTAGYGAASAVPQALKQSILMLLRHWFDECDDTSSVPMAVESLIGMHRVQSAA